MITDETLIRIGQAVQLSHQGERDAARVLFAEIWDEIGGEHGDPLHTCTLAHAMADVQDDVHQELVWDQRALAAADLLTDARLTRAGLTISVAGLYPSLHLNLSECHRKLGDLDRAREQLQQAQATIGALGDDGYAQVIKEGMRQLAERLPAREGGSEVPPDDPSTGSAQRGTGLQ
ncbi:hypothetical protein SAMN05660350_04852 [Geodermatophilus obscurus]|uniref:Tetratricopeptide repeat-containing protein n=1 Tax=Geodermatophilus obscurus TaxID=1861 RepID=A0A1M7V0Z9_9ACTN|nr:hypothetical protein [Geodermatophilus obscurus]SHN88862.1 hypothetical protein SAMN05660350_04852 [Geodermatophilus obscurus]